MPVLSFQFYRGGLHFPALGLWLDPHEPQGGPEKVFVSHAHSDHTGAHREVILSEPTARLMQARIGGQRLEHVLPFHEKREFEGGGERFHLTLLPAGHIFGSAMSLLEAGSESVLYTGDFKLRRGLSAEPCDPAAAKGVDVLIMETTFGRPEYRFPPTPDVMQGVVRFCREALDNDETAVLLGYSLGKSQEVLCALGEAKLPIMLHGSVFKLTQIYERFGQCFPAYERYDAARARGKVLLCPPNVAGSAMLRKLGKIRSAVLTGWAVDPNCRYRYQCDAAFPLSDHADYPDLLDLVRQVEPKMVYTLHGFAADFAQRLRAEGFAAQALSEAEQMILALPPSPSKVALRRSAATALSALTPAPDLADAAGLPSSFSGFAKVCAAIAATPAKLEKVSLLAQYFKTVDATDLPRVSVWFTGLPFPSSENKVLQLGWGVLRDALVAVSEVDESGFHQVYLKHSDLGETAQEILAMHGPPASRLKIEDVDRFFRQSLDARGPTGKLPLLTGILRRSRPLEAKFLVKIITSDLRIGLKEGLVEEAIATAFGVAAERVREANLLLGNIGATALLARNNTLETASLVPFRPLKFMLASPEETAADIWERMRERHEESLRTAEPARDARAQDGGSEGNGLVLWLEDKYDGIRCQMHKVGSRVELYSRDLKEITAGFHDLVEPARQLAMDVILDGEILAMRDDVILPFADLQKRLGRREADLFMGEEIPIKYVAFDLLWLNGVNYLKRPLRERRTALERLGLVETGPRFFRLARITQAASEAEIETAFSAARARDNEGLMVKDPDSIYSPGRRGLSWLKLKKALATLDCVVVGAEYGHGKRKAVLSDYTFAVRDDESGELKTIGKAYTGLTDDEIARLTEHFLSRAISQHGRYYEVEPDTVLEIAFDRLQVSNRHSSGLAMRFPRIIRIRTDKSPREIDTVATARNLLPKRAGASVPPAEVT